MKKIILLSLILIAVQSQLMAQSQEKITTKYTIYKVKMMLHSQEKVEGFLFHVTDSTITISNSGNKYDYFSGNYEKVKYRIDQINWVKVHRKDGGGLGSMLGAVVGGKIGYDISKGVRTRSYKGVTYKAYKRKLFKGGAIGVVVGGSLGVLIGRRSLRRDLSNPAPLLRKLKRRAIKKNLPKEISYSAKNKESLQSKP